MTDSLTVPCFEFEDGSRLRDVEVVYQTWGELNVPRDNVVLVCHTLTGNPDVSDWWGGDCLARAGHSIQMNTSSSARA